MKIGVNTLFYIPREVGGSETYLTSLLDALLAHFPDITLMLFTNRENHALFAEKYQGNSRISLVRLNFPARNRVLRVIREQTELPWKARKLKLDLLWSPGYTMPFFAPCPQVLSILDMQYRNFPEDFTWMARLLIHGLVTMGSRRSTAIMTISDFSKREICRYTKIESARVFVSHLAVREELKKHLLASDAEKQLADLPGLKKPYLLCVALSYPHKNLELLAESFYELTDKIPHQLVLVGQAGSGERELAKKWDKIPPGRGLRFPWLESGQLAALYRGADIFILPSLYEGFGLPILEAMLAETPVIATRCGSIPEVGEDYVVYFKEKDKEDLKKKIVEVLSWNVGQREERMEKAKLKTFVYSWQRASEETMNCFQKVVA